MFAGSDRDKVAGVDTLGRWGDFGLALSLDDLTDVNETRPDGGSRQTGSGGQRRRQSVSPPAPELQSRTHALQRRNKVSTHISVS